MGGGGGGCCKTCGGTDHTRRSSKKCKDYLPPIRKRKLSNGEDLEIYNVKRGLESVLCPLLEREKKQRLLSEIRRDVFDLSRVYVRLGVWINHHVKTSPAGIAKLDILNFVYAMKGKGPYAEAYRSVFGRDSYYDGKLRSFVIFELAKQYETVLHTNISTHTYARLARYFKVKRNDPTLYDAYFKKKLPNDNHHEEIRRVCSVINVDSVKSSFGWWKTLPLWLEIQETLQDFRLFPQPTHGLKHITYTSNGWHELIRRVDLPSLPSIWSKITDHMAELWSPWLSIDTRKFGCCIQTDGVNVSLSMNRRRRRSQSKVKRSKQSYDRIIAVDPGSRLPVATVESKFGHFQRVTRKYVRSHTLEWKRERTRNKLLRDVELAEQKDRETHEKPPSSKNVSRVQEYTAFRIKWFDARQEPFERHSKLTRLALDRYIRSAKCEERIIKEVFGTVENTLVLYGAGSKFMNTATFSGRKFKHDSLIKRLRSKRNITVEIVDEAYTSQACSTCNQNTGGFHKIVMNHRLRRGVCPNCRGKSDRDENAARNILINYTWSTICRPGCLSAAAAATS